MIRTADRRNPVVEAFAVRDGRILGVGTSLAMQAHRGPDTRMLDVGDAAVYPGFVDVHNHHAMAGRTELFELSLPPSLALDDILDLVRDRAQTLPPDAWIVGGSVSTTLLPALANTATRQRLDEAASARISRAPDCVRSSVRPSHAALACGPRVRPSRAALACVVKNARAEAIGMR